MSYGLFYIKFNSYGSVSHRKQYIKAINKIYQEKFQTLDEYKEEKNFKRILSKISLEDVKFAINNGNLIRQKNKEIQENNYKKYGKFEYFTENPDITVNECVEQILKECGALKINNIKKLS